MADKTAPLREIAPSSPIILAVEGWRGAGRGVVILDWSEMDRGPVPAEFVYATPDAQGLRDQNGSLIGGLYAVDFQRGIDDFKAGRSAPDLTTASYDLGRQRASEDAAASAEILAKIEADSAAATARVRAMLTPEQRAEYDAVMEDTRSGRSEARMSWQSISDAQRRVIRTLAIGGRRLRRTAGQKFYDAFGEPHAEAKVASAATIRAMVSRRLLAWSGPASDPENRAEMTEKCRLVIDVMGLPTTAPAPLDGEAGDLRPQGASTSPTNPTTD